MTVTLEQYFRLSSYALVATGFAALAATGQLDWVTIFGFGAALIAGWIVDGGRWGRQIPARRVKWLFAGALLLLVADWRLIGSPVAVALIRFVCCASAIKLLRPKANRDWRWLYVVAFLEMVLASGMTIDTTFFFLLVVFLLAAVSTLVSFEIRRAGQACAAPAAPAREPRLRSLAYFSVAALGLILLLAAPLFLAMPRFARGTLGGGLLPAAALSGFSDSVRLGEIARVKLNPQVVMRVRAEVPPGQEPSRLRWRGVTFNYYDGQSWSETGPGAREVERVGDGFRVEQLVSREQRRGLTRQTFYLEPLSINTIFAAPRPVWAHGVPALARDAGDGLWAARPTGRPLTYTVYSDTRPATEEALRADNSRHYPAEVRQRYLQLPEDRDRRIDELAAELARGAGAQLEIARRVEQHLRTAYDYSLDLERTTDDDPLADFLFNFRKGHCEYFATAMTILLRARRVPARLVNGFQTGEYSEVSEAYTVRQSDAHSWVEVYFPEHGWVAFDPTPPGGLNTYDDGLLGQLRRYGEALEMFWQERIVGFSTSDQVSIIFAAQRWLAAYQNAAALRWLDWRFNLTRWLEGGRGGWGPSGAARAAGANGGWLSRPQALAGFGAAGLALAVAVWWREQNSWRRRMRRDAAGSAVAFYQEMLRALERAGRRRRPDQTPLEFARETGLPGVAEVTRLYQQARFGGGLTEAEIKQVSLRLRELKSSRGRGMAHG